MNRPPGPHSESLPRVLRDGVRWQNLSYLQPGLRHEIAGVHNTLGLHAHLVSRAAETPDPDTERLGRWAAILTEELDGLRDLLGLSLGLLAPDRDDPCPARAASVTSRVASLVEPRAREIGLRVESRVPEDLLLPLGEVDLEDILLDLGVDALRRHRERDGGGTLVWSPLHREGEVGIGFEDGAERGPGLDGPLELPLDPSRLDPDRTHELILFRALVSCTGGRWHLREGREGRPRLDLLWPLDPKEESTC